jgi:hypothetical protein
MVAIRFAKDEAGEAKFWLEKVPLDYVMGEIKPLLSASRIPLDEQYKTWLDRL